MAGPVKKPLFLARDTYRQRRLRDVAKVVPVAGALALLLPLLWGQEPGTRTSSVFMFLFGLWCLLILWAAILARLIRPDESERPPQETDE